MSDDANLTIYGPSVRGRGCGNCTACCTWVPVKLPQGDKPAGMRCPMLRSTGCSIYARRPDACRMWSCRWLFDESTAELRRPDHAGYAIDPVPDRVIIDGQMVAVIQIWLDPARPDAHRDPALRRWLQMMAVKHHCPAIVRRGCSADGMLFCPPALSTDGDWFEKAAPLLSKPEMAEKLAAIEEETT